MSGASLGTFFGVGVGPGDPELITRKAEHVLAAADWIFYPAGSRDGGSFVLGIVRPLALPESKFRPVSLCMGGDRRAVCQAYEQAARAIAEELRQGRSVAWITEGDPLFYSTFLHLREQVARCCPGALIEVVPGVTSLSAAAARAGVPVARLEERVAVVPAAQGLNRLPALLEEFATVVLLKVSAVGDRILEVLTSLRGVKAVYLEKVGTPEERVVTDLQTLRGRKLPYFSLVILRREREEEL